MKARHALRDEQWERIRDLLPGRVGQVGVTARDNRLFVEAVLYRYRAGIPWRDLPARFGDFRVVPTRFSRWSKSRVWEPVFAPLAQDADNEWVMIDSTIVRSHPHSAGAIKEESAVDQAIGRSRCGLSTKIHATVDALGNPTGFHLTPEQAHDLTGADVLLADTQADGVLVDKAYDAQERLIEPLEKAGKQIVIPPVARTGFSAAVIGLCTKLATGSKISSPDSSSTAPSPPATTKPLAISSAPFIWRPPSFGSIDDTH
jgi:transposase